jgi:hypothetical protein
MTITERDVIFNVRQGRKMLAHYRRKTNEELDALNQRLDEVAEKWLEGCQGVDAGTISPADHDATVRHLQSAMEQIKSDMARLQASV